MLKASYVLLTLAIMALLIIGCSDAGVEPAMVPDATDVPIAAGQSDSQRMLWGMWNISFDPTELTITIKPLRNLQAHYNITDMITPPACDDCLDIAHSFDPVTRILDADITLRNPTSLSAYDIRGILYTNYYGHELLNADDWTGLFDITGGDDINPFKAFAKAEPNRIFTSEAEHTEEYLLHIPTPPQWWAITYAVEASWPVNCREPYEITNFWQETIYDTPGSTGNIYIDVHDWQNDANQVRIIAPEITGEEFTQFSHLSGDTWILSLSNNTGAGPGHYKSKVIATSTNSYEIALYDFVDIIISQDPSSNEGWARTWGGNGPDYAYGVVTDGLGNTYIAGSFHGYVDFDPGTGIDGQTSNGEEDAFLSKFDSNGNFLWAHTWGGNGQDYALCVDIDDSGNTYVAGFFHGTVDFDPGTGINEHTSNGCCDDFLSKFSSNGNFLWARTWGASSPDSVYCVAMDDSGNIYVAGSFISIVDFDPGTGIDEHTSNGAEDAFLSKFDSNGDFLWARTWGGDFWDYSRGVVTDDSGNTYVAGSFINIVDFDPGTGIDEHTSNEAEDAFLSKFDSNGDFLWARTWGGSGAGPYGDIARSVVTDDSGNIYVGGAFYSTVDFDPGTGIDEHTSNGYADAFLSKFDSNGNFLWARTWGGNGGYYNSDNAQSVVTDNSGNCYVAGYFSYTVDFDPGTGIDEHTSNGYPDAFLSKFDSNGNFLWARTWGGNGVDYYSDNAQSVVTDDSGNTYVTGWFYDTVDFDPGTGIDEQTSNGEDDAFLIKFLPNGYWE